jgi:uncharacterized short protein YbdD (DUF466 family)
MICRCFGHSLDLSALARGARQTARLMVGVPDYQTYLDHLAATHPDQTPMARQDFFRERQQARYGAGGGLRCC